MNFFTLNTRSISFALRIMAGCAIVWWSLYAINDKSKVWALISVIIVSDPNFEAVRTNTISRIINTAVGCFLGLTCLYLLGVNEWSLMTGVVLSVIISTSFKNYPSSWKLAPVTVVIIIAPSIFENAKLHEALVLALTRTAEVMYGSLVALVMGYVYYKFRHWVEKPS